MHGVTAASNVRKLHAQQLIFKAPPKLWIEERVSTIQKVLEKRTQKSALLLREFLGRIQLKPTRGAIGCPCYVAKSNLHDLLLLKGDTMGP